MNFPLGLTKCNLNMLFINFDPSQIQTYPMTSNALTTAPLGLSCVFVKYDWITGSLAATNPQC